MNFQMRNTIKNIRSHAFRRCVFSMALCIAGGALVHASPWRSTLYPETWLPPDASVSFYTDKLIQDFSYAGYRRGEELIPVITGPVFNVTSYGADPTGASDSTSAIQAAINAAALAGGGVVFLPSGEFRVSPQGTNTYALRIPSSNVVLRGAGRTETFLLNTSYEMRGKAVIQISPPSNSTGTTVNITADLPGPTRRIPVSNATAFAPGDFVLMQWTFTDAWIAEHNQQRWWSANARPADARYYREVLAANPTEGWIEIDVPTRYAMWVRDNARVSIQNGFISEVGVEDLSIGNLQHPGTEFAENDYTDSNRAAYDTHASWLIRMSYTRDSWVSGVDSFRAATNTTTAHMLSNGISLVNCFRVTVRDSEMRRAQYGGGGGNGYMFRVQHSNECLIKDAVAEFSRHGFVISHAGTSGNVFLRVEDRETARATGSTGSYNTNGNGSDHHMHFSHSNLFDQCHVHNSFFTAHHRVHFGTIGHALTSAHGLYWNTSGSGTRGGSIVRSEQGRYGYVIGTSGSRYAASNPTGGGTAPADHLEGIGIGDTLEPASLYFDQLSRRLLPVVTYHGNEASAGVVPIDANSPYEHGAIVTVLDAGNLQRTHFTFAGWNTVADGTGTYFAPGSTVEINAPVNLFAQWQYAMRVDAGLDETVALTQLMPWTPAFMDSALWYDAADSTTLSEGADGVSQWNDKSGNNNHVTQGMAANRPSTKLATIGGLPAVSFRAAQQKHLSAANSVNLNLDGSGGVNIFAVFNYHKWVDQGSDLNVVLSKGPVLSPFPAYGIRIGSDNALGIKGGVGQELDGGSGFLRRNLLYSAMRNNAEGSFRLYLNGDLKDSATIEETVASDSANPFFIGRDPSFARFADVDIGEILVVGGGPSDDDHQRVEGYLAHKWGLAKHLPINHTYRFASPINGLATVDISGIVSDGVGGSLSHHWSLVSGPAPITFVDSFSLNTTATFTQIGVYILRLTSEDSSGSSFGELAVTVGYESGGVAFDLWAGGESLTFTGDANGDGVADGLAWLLGAQNPRDEAQALLPIGILNQFKSEMGFHFSLLSEVMRGSAPVKLSYSTDLLTWTSTPVPAESGTHNGVEFVITSNGMLDDVLVIFPGNIGSNVFVRIIGFPE